MNISAEEINRAIEYADETTQDKIQRLRDFTPENDIKIIEVLEEQLKCKIPDACDFKLKQQDDSSPQLERSSMRSGLGSVEVSNLFSSLTQSITMRLKIEKFKVDEHHF